MKSLCIAFALVLTATTPAIAGTTGKITGEVKDSQTGEPVIGANVIVEGTTAGAATNIEGYFVILNLPPGKYNLVSSSVGYSRQTVMGLTVSIDLTTTQNFSLSPTVVEGEEVVITAERPLIKKISPLRSRALMRVRSRRSRYQR